MRSLHAKIKSAKPLDTLLTYSQNNKISIRTHPELHNSRCTAIHNAHLWVLFSLGVNQNKEGYNATVFNKYNSLLQLFIFIITIP